MPKGCLMGEIRYSVEPYTRCRDVVVKLRNETRSTVREPSYFTWRYEGRPCAEPAQVSIAWDDDRPVGVLTAIPHDYFVLDRVAPLGFIGDFSVSSGYRGRGIGTGVMAALCAADCTRRWRGILGLPNRAAESAHRCNGHTFGSGLGRYVRLLPARGAGGLRGAVTGLAAWLMMPAFRDFSGALPAGLQFGSGRGFDARYDELWERLPKSGRIVSVRSAAYLRWRFERHPLHRFETFELSSGAELRGYFTLRTEGGSAYVGDFCALDLPSADALLRQVLRELRRRGGSGRIVLQISQGFWPAVAWGRYGFIARRDRQLSAWAPAAGASREDPAATATTWHLTSADKDV